MARKGKIGSASIVTKNCTSFNSNDNVVNFKIIDKEVNPYYFVTFFNSRYGLKQVERISTGNVQPWLSMFQLRNLRLYKLSFLFQGFIEKLVFAAYTIFKKSKSVYQQAEDLLLSELGLKDWQPTTEESFAVKSCSESFLSSDRLDAEYYQPKFDQLIDRLKEKVKLTPLRDLLTLNQRGKQPIYIENEENYQLGLTVINSKHVREGEVLFTDNRCAYLPEIANPLTIQTDDVLINGTGVGTIGRCAPYLYEQQALPDNHVTILRTDLLDPVYLSIYLNSIVGKLQVDKHLLCDSL